MRGTVLRLRSDIVDCSSADDGSSEEQHNSNSVSLTNCFNSNSTENEAQDVKKNTLMTNLDLCRSSISRVETNSLNIPALQRPVFEWNDASMWKAMSRHPLFSKYMELQSQLNSLFEEIRMDCKKAACEKAFASLLKETADSPIVVTSVVQSKPTTETPIKRKGRPPLKKKPGRPRKYISTASSPEWSNSPPVTLTKPARKCREELFLSRKPSWVCQNCARKFSSSGWLERHQSFCSFSKLPQPDSQDVNEDLSQTSSCVDMLSQNTTTMSEETADKDCSAPKLLDPLSALSSSRSSSSKTTEKAEVPAIPTLPNNTPSMSPLKPKMENHNCMEDEDVVKKPLFDDESHCAPVEGSVISCEKCDQGFNTQAHLQRHWEESPDCKSYASLRTNDKESGDYSSDSSVSSCKHCGKSFRKYRLLKLHQSICHINSKRKMWQCTQCFKSFRRHLHFEQHQKDCYPKKKHIEREIQRCENCSMLFPTQKKLLKHQAICCPDSNNHMIKLLKCLKCSLMFPSYKRQLKHRAVCCPDSDTDAMVCQHCFKVFLMADRMAAHKKKCFKGVPKKLK